MDRRVIAQLTKVRSNSHIAYFVLDNFTDILWGHIHSTNSRCRLLMLSIKSIKRWKAFLFLIYADKITRIKNYKSI